MLIRALKTWAERCEEMQEGQEYEREDSYARKLIAAGLAEEVPPDMECAAVAGAPENAMKRNRPQFRKK